jgi:AcrR family transcriptional regulator
MTEAVKKADPRRNKGFEATHIALIEAAVKILTSKGVEALSVAAVARAVGINRTTVYYHFDGRDALLTAVRSWSAEQLAKGFSPDVPQRERIDFIGRFVLQNPELLKLWVEEVLTPGDIRESYPEWDGIVAGLDALLREKHPDEQVDAEIYAINMLISAFVAPHVFHMRVRPDLGIEEVIARFRAEQQRMLRRDSLPLD